MKVFQPFRDTEQLQSIRKTKLTTCCRCHGNGEISHQRCSSHVRIRRYILTDVAVLFPVINESEFEEGRIDAEKR